ncbi:uncharacterized protein RCC_06152 [Ramularia collo-cygni]|uniref:RNase H type-1 domain-containing protein n=1 Tax=Ramularia collo-cygni TaxID=112498 RepID=A0A2D3VC35_9PEZI|nr:uncharacterized protein RCC_06152 [Ramularia collo-cygni]CZT20294.1 uncharacterized protein RCC_06152 [Ramularia collo-cygni]
MSTLHMYPDGSELPHASASGGGLAILHDNMWTFYAFSFDDATNSDVAECKAIQKALQVAVSITADRRHDIVKVMLYTDSQAALILLNQTQNGETRRQSSRDEVADGILASMIILDARNIACEAMWIRGHAGDEGNEYADVLARYGAEKCRIGWQFWDQEFAVDRQEFEHFRQAMRGRRFNEERMRDNDHRVRIMEFVQWERNQVYGAERQRNEAEVVRRDPRGWRQMPETRVDDPAWACEYDE